MSGEPPIGPHRNYYAKAHHFEGDNGIWYNDAPLFQQKTANATAVPAAPGFNQVLYKYSKVNNQILLKLGGPTTPIDIVGPGASIQVPLVVPLPATDITWMDVLRFTNGVTSGLFRFTLNTVGTLVIEKLESRADIYEQLQIGAINPGNPWYLDTNVSYVTF